MLSLGFLILIFKIPPGGKVLLSQVFMLFLLLLEVIFKFVHYIPLACKSIGLLLSDRPQQIFEFSLLLLQHAHLLLLVCLEFVDLSLEQLFL